MQPAAFDRALPKSGQAAAGRLHGHFPNSTYASSSGAIHSDTDSGTDSDDDVLKITVGDGTGGRKKRSPAAFVQQQQQQQGLFSTPQRGQITMPGTPSDIIATPGALRGGAAFDQQQEQQRRQAQALSDKFFDPKLVRIRAEANRKRSAHTNAAAAAAGSDDAAALGPAAAATAEKSYRLVRGELKCRAQFAPTPCCIDENPTDILRMQVPPAVEHATMISFQAENLIIVFGGLCETSNDAQARATVSGAGRRGGGHDNNNNDDDDGDEHESGDLLEEEDMGKRRNAEMPVCGVASNTTWLYDTKNLIWSCVAESDILEQHRRQQKSGGGGGGSKGTAATTTSFVDDHDDPFSTTSLAALCPAPRCGHTAVAMFEDPLPQPTKLPGERAKEKPVAYAHEPMMVIFGGCDLRKQVAFGDVWAFFVRQRKWKCLFNAAVVPRGSLTFSLDLLQQQREQQQQTDSGFVTKRKDSFFPDDAAFFEGQDVRARLLALTGTVTGAKLHAVATSHRSIRRAKAPSQRWKAVAGAMDELMFIFGGEGAAFDVLDDLHTFNCLTQQWEAQRTRMSPWPSARFMHAACTVGAKMIVSGGTGKRSDLVLQDDTWILEMRTLLWRPVTGTAEVLASASSVSDALGRCPFLTRPRHVPQAPKLISAAERRMELRASHLLSGSSSSSSPAKALSVALQLNLNNNPDASALIDSLSSQASALVARCEIEGPILLPFDDRILFYGGREVPTGRFVEGTYVLDLISERWFRADEILMDQTSLFLHGDIRQLQEQPTTEKTDSLLPARRWAHCGCALVKFSPTQHMNLSRGLSSVARLCGGNNICGTVRFTDQSAIDAYIDELRQDVVEQSTFDGVLATRQGKPVMSKTLRAFFFGGGATCSGIGSAVARKADLADCWQINLTIGVPPSATDKQNKKGSSESDEE